MKLYKLTDKNGMTQNNTRWGVGVSHELKATNKPLLCSGSVLHAYKNLNLALLLNPTHANICNPRLWEAEGDVCVEDWGKCGTFKLTTVAEIFVPDWYTDQNRRKRVSVAFAILCAEAALSAWTNRYPDDDRPRKAIESAKQFLNNKCDAADAADAAYVAYAAAYAAADAAARAAADAAARAAAYAAYAAAYAAGVAGIDFCKLADEAVRGE